MKNNIVVRKRIGGILVTICLLFIFLTGCGSNSDLDTTTITLQKDGKVIQTIVEDFPEDNYSIDEFTQMNENAVSDYNDNLSTDAIKIHSTNVSDGKIKVIMEYNSANDYYEFNGKLLYVGTIDQANTAGYNLNQNYINVKTNEPATQDEVLGNTGSHIAIVSEPIDLITFSKILYVSEGVTNKDKKKATVDEDTQGYIIFK